MGSAEFACRSFRSCLGAEAVAVQRSHVIAATRESRANACRPNPSRSLGCSQIAWAPESAEANAPGLAIEGLRLGDGGGDEDGEVGARLGVARRLEADNLSAAAPRAASASAWHGPLVN